MDIITWEEIKNSIKDNENNVLLGNGFSMSYQMKNFNQVEIINEMPTLKDLGNVDNIEICIKKTIEKISESDNSDTIPKEIIAKWITSKLRSEFVETLFKKLPKSLKDIDGYDIQKINAYKEFFSLFDNTYTLNYDPLIYWLFLNFTNYGEQDFLDVLSLTSQISDVDEKSCEYKKLQKSLNSKISKCETKIKKDFLPKYMGEENSDYNVKVFYKNSCLMNDILGAAKYVTKTIFEKVYKIMEDKKEENNVEINQEKEKIDACVESGIKTKTNELRKSQDEYNIKLSDGFNSGKWKSDYIDSQTLHFLHGAIHIVEKQESQEVEKIQADDAGNMLKNIATLWANGFESLIVLESSADDKMKRIKTSPYLKNCFDKFKTISGNLVSFGVAFENSDEHIIKAIKNNQNIQNIYIGGFSKDEIIGKIAPKFIDDNRVKFFITKDFFEKIQNDIEDKSNIIATT